MTYLRWERRHVIFRDRATTEAGLYAGRQSSAVTRWLAARRTPEVEAEKSEKLGEKITIHRREGTRCRVMCTHARPPPFVRMHARNARAGRKKILPPGTPSPRGLITMITGERPESLASNQTVISKMFTATINYSRLQDAILRK